MAIGREAFSLTRLTILLPLLFALLTSGPASLEAVAQSPQPLLAQLGAVKVAPGRGDILRILGSAEGPAFSSFRLEYGEGEFPQGWEEIRSSGEQIVEGLLGEWSTAVLPSDLYTLRLTVSGPTGQTFSDRILIKLGDYRPDLTLPRVGGEVRGEQLHIVSALENIGSHPTQRPFSVDFYLSKDSSDPVSDQAWQIHLGSYPVSSLEAGAFQALKTQFAVPSRVPDGIYSLLARADAGGVLAEGREDNNQVSALTPISLFADLAMAELDSVLEGHGSRISIRGKVKNLGNRPSKRATSLTLYLSSDGEIDGQDLKLGEVELRPLGPEAVSTFQTGFPLPPALPAGPYYVMVHLDPEHKIPQGERDNDTFWGNPVMLGPDLAPTDLSFQISEDGREIVLAATIQNLGRYPTLQSFKVRYSLLPEDGSAQEQDSEYILGSRELSPLAPGEAASGRTSFPIGVIPRGNYTVKILVDPMGMIKEVTRANNERRKSPVDIGPDLRITLLDTELTPDGERVKIHFKVANRGSLPVDRAFSVGFYLSGDERLDPEDRLLGSRRVRELNTGTEFSEKASFPLPAGAALANSFVLAAADPEGMVPETRTDNNTASGGRLLSVDADLVLSDLFADLFSGGEKIVLTNTVKNLGSGDISRPFSVGFYLSKDGVIDPEDLFLGKRRLEGLKAGALSTANTTLALPVQTGVGKLSVLARTDLEDEVKERRENNNDYWGSSLHLGPDLLLSKIEGQLDPTAHEIRVLQKIENRGNRPAARGVQVAVYLSKDTELDPGDLLLGREEIEALKAGQGIELQSTFPIPASLQDGAYVLLGAVDPDRVIPEVEEGNNGASGGAVFFGPDLVVKALKSAVTMDGEFLAVRIEDEVLNQGNRPVSGPVEVFYILSKNWSIDRSDIFLGQRTIDGIGAGERSRATTLLRVPKKKEVPTGRYFILARVDAANTVSETDERNNTRPTIVPLVIRRSK